MLRGPVEPIVTTFGTLTPTMIEASINAAARLGAFDPEHMPTDAEGSMYFLLNQSHEAANQAIGEGTGAQAIWRFHELILEELGIEPVEGARLPDPLEAGFAVYRNDPESDFVRMIVATDLADLLYNLGHDTLLFASSSREYHLMEIKIRPQLLTPEGREAERSV